jgi:hypothetical protein
MRKDRRISVKGRKRREVDIKKMSRALLVVAAQQAAEEAAAQAQHTAIKRGKAS